MPGPAHDFLVMALRERPDLLARLLALVSSAPLPDGLVAADTTLRLADVSEVRPDLLFTRAGGHWVLVEVQHRVDPGKRLAWAKAVVLLLTEHGRMGDLIVLTPSRRVASWARRVVRWSGAQETQLVMRPRVVHLSLGDAERLVASDDPGLALVAAWTVQKKVGPRAVRLLNRVMTVVEQLPPELSDVYESAIFQMLNERLLDKIRSGDMELKDLPKSEGFKRFERRLLDEGRAEGREQGREQGLREAMADLCEAFGVSLTAQRRRELAGMDLAGLEGLRAHLKLHRAWPTGR